MGDLTKLVGAAIGAIGVAFAVISGVIGLVFVVSVILAIPVWLLWNWLCPTIWGWPDVSLLQAWGLLLLCGFLFKPSSTSSKS